MTIIHNFWLKNIKFVSLIYFLLLLIHKDLTIEYVYNIYTSIQTFIY